MELKNQMWVSYNNQPHFIEHIRTNTVLIRNLKEDTSVVSKDKLSPINIPQFTKGDIVVYTDTYHKNLIGKMVTVRNVTNKDNAYAPYEVACGSDVEYVTPFDVVRLNYWEMDYEIQEHWEQCMGLLQ